jgi:hypothetical protein
MSLKRSRSSSATARRPWPRRAAAIASATSTRETVAVGQPGEIVVVGEALDGRLALADPLLHAAELAGELADLAAIGERQVDGVVAAGEPARCLLERAHRPRDAAGDERRAESGEQHRGDGDPQHLAGEGAEVEDGLRRGAHEDAVDVRRGGRGRGAGAASRDATSDSTAGPTKGRRHRQVVLLVEAQPVRPLRQRGAERAQPLAGRCRERRGEHAPRLAGLRLDECHLETGEVAELARRRVVEQPAEQQPQRRPRRRHRHVVGGGHQLVGAAVEHHRHRLALERALRREQPRVREGAVAVARLQRVDEHAAVEVDEQRQLGAGAHAVVVEGDEQRLLVAGVGEDRLAQRVVLGQRLGHLPEGALARHQLVVEDVAAVEKLVLDARQRLPVGGAPHREDGDAEHRQQQGEEDDEDAALQAAQGQ